MELAGSSLTQTFPIWLSGNDEANSPPTALVHNDETNTATLVNTNDFQLPDLDDFFLNLISNTNEIENNETTTTAASALSGSSAGAVGNKYLENTASASALDLFDWNGDEFLLALDDLNFASTNNNDQDVALAIDRIDSPSAEITYSNVNNEMTQTTNTFITSPATNITAQFYDESSASSMPYSPAPSSLSFAPSSVSGPLTTSSGSEWKRVRHKAIDKKESNKAAAERYRFKKLREKELLFGECELYAKKNADLKRKISDIQTEISFIKSLLVEALIAKTSSSSSSSSSSCSS